MKKIIASTLFALLLPFANASLAEDICHNPQAERDILECSAQKKDEAEVLLNKQFSEAKKTVQHAYRAKEELGKQYFSVLLDGQRGWLKYRDAQCKLEAFSAEEGTSANAIANNECIARLDNDRSENLKKVPY